jgi:hypothetical protein
MLPVILLGVLILSNPSCRYIKQRLSLGEYSLKAAIEWAKRDSARVADSLKSIRADKTITEKPVPESVRKELTKKKVFEKTLTDSLMSIGDNDQPQGNAGTTYYIIAGSFTSQENAKKRAAEYSAKGYSTSIIHATKQDGTKVEHVSVKTFSDQNKAKLFLYDFKAKHDPGAWIYSRR